MSGLKERQESKSGRVKDFETSSVAFAISNRQKGTSDHRFIEDNRPQIFTQRKLNFQSQKSRGVQEALQLKSIANNYAIKHLQAQKGLSSKQLKAKNENNTGLPDNLKSGIENLSGYSMDDVKVHYNSDKPAQLNAHAYAQGTDIHLASGQEKHLPHEAWHVVQQKQGRVRPTMQMKENVNINDDEGLEKEADIMGEKATRLTSNSANLHSNNEEPTKGTLVQLKIENGNNPIQAKNDVIQLARWRLIAPNSWIGIDPENKGQSYNYNSGNYPIGSIIEDTTLNVITPTPPGGNSLPSGSYGDWRKVARPDEQVDHFPPNAAYKGTPYESTPPSRRPAFPIRNREGHRPKKGDEYGYGGHVSSTNRTFVQKGWTPDLNAMLKTGDFFEAMKREIADKSNVALMQYNDRSAFNELLKPGIKLSYEKGWISEYGYFALLSMLDHYERNPKG